MDISLNGYKVVYDNKVLNALSLLGMSGGEPEEKEKDEKRIIKPDFLSILAVDTDGTITIIEGEAREFQFIPRIN